MFERLKAGLKSVPLADALTVIPGLAMGGIAAAQSATEDDPLGTMALKSLAAGSAGALAGRYATPLLKQGLKEGASQLANNMRGKGYMTAALGIPVAGAAGALAYQAARGLNVPLDSNRVPGFQNKTSQAMDQAAAEYEAAIQQEMDMAYLNQTQNAPIDPEQYGSSNTMNASMSLG